MIHRRSLRSLTAALVLCATTEALAQRHARTPRTPPAPVAPQIPANSTFDPNEVISVDVTQVDGMLRRMRVYLLLAANGDGSYGLANLGPGRRFWAVLPSCRERNDVDSREPCPVERVVLEAVGRGNVTSGDPQNLDLRAPDSRRAQGFVVAEGTTRVRIKVVGPNARVRYEAVVEAARLVDLQPPQGAVANGRFEFDLTQYPAR